MDDTNGGIYQFGEFVLEAREHRLTGGSGEIRLRPKSFMTLLYLVQRHGQLVKKEELLEQVWAGTFVTESVAFQCIHDVRMALGDDSEQPRYIQTIPRVGYRFTGEVTEVFSPDRAEGWDPGHLFSSLKGKPGTVWTISLLVLVSMAIVAVASWLFLGVSEIQPGEIDSVAVLPFDNLSNDPNQDYFAEGITDALITELAKLHALRVISRQSVMQFKRSQKTLPEIARELNVDALIEGTVVRDGDRVRITAQLIRAEPEEHLWAESYSRSLSSIPALQTELARAITTEIKSEVTPEEASQLSRTRNIDPEAYDLCLLGQFYLHKFAESPALKAIELFQEAIKKDPACAEARAGLAESYLWLTHAVTHPSSELFGEAEAAVEKALTLNPSLGEVHSMQARILSYYRWDWEAAGREHQLALHLSPGSADVHHSYSRYLQCLSQPDEALIHMEMAVERDPLSLNLNVSLLEMQAYPDQLEEVRERLLALLEMEPGFVYAYWTLGKLYMGMHLYEEAVETFEAQMKLMEGENVSDELGAIVRCYALQGKQQEAKEYLGRLIEYSKDHYVAPPSSLRPT